MAIVEACSQIVEDADVDGGSTFFPYDVLREICSHLPVKSLCRLQSVCRDLRNMIKLDRSLPLLQLHHPTTTDGIFIQTYRGTEFVALDPQSGVPPGSLAAMEETSAWILGSYCGLIFYYGNDWSDNIWVYNPATQTRTHLPAPPTAKDWSDNIWVYNPATQARRHLPASPIAKIFSGSSCIVVMARHDDDAPTKEKYQVILVTMVLEPESYGRWGSTFELRVRVFDSTARAWTPETTFHDRLMDIDLDSPVIWGDTVFWASNCHPEMDPYVLCLDVKEERSCTEIIPVPEDAIIDHKNEEISMGVWEDKSPCLLHYSNMHARSFSAGSVTVWALVRGDGGRKSSWKKVYKVSHLDGHGFRQFSNNLRGMLLVFYTEEGHLLAYSIKDDKTDELRPGCKTNCSTFFPPRFLPYSNLLTPCKVLFN